MLTAKKRGQGWEKGNEGDRAFILWLRADINVYYPFGQVEDLLNQERTH